MAKQIQIGHHIFYRLNSGLGTDAAFSQRYAGKEPDLPPPPSAVAVAAEATDQAQALIDPVLGAEKPPQVAADAAGLAGADQPKQVLLADANKPTLLIDKVTNAAVPVTKSKRASDDCHAEGGKQLRPASPNDLHSGGSANGC
jgi:hypothetical protein